MEGVPEKTSNKRLLLKWYRYFIVQNVVNKNEYIHMHLDKLVK